MGPKARKRAQTTNKRTSQPAENKRKSKYQRTDEEVIDPDYGVRIFKMPGVSPSFCVQYNDPVVGQRRKTADTRNKKEARRVAFGIVTKLREGRLELGKRRSPKLVDVVADFLADKKRIGRRASTIVVYERLFEQLIKFCSDRSVLRLDQITPQIASGFETQLREAGVPLEKKRGARAKANKGSTVHEKVKQIKSLMKWAVRRGLIATNPIAGYELPADSSPENYCFNQDEVDAICKHADAFFGRVFRFLAITGLRQGEVIWLTKRDVDLEQRMLFVRETTSKSGRPEWRPKGDERVVPLTREAAKVVAEMIEASSSQWVFEAPPAPGVRDKRLRPGRLHRQLASAKAKAKIEKGVLHSFRHFFVSTMANAGASPFKVMKIVGHKSLDIVLTYYHVSSEELVAAVDAVDFGSGNTPTETQK